MRSDEVKRELETIWRIRACLQPNHKLGLVLNTPAAREAGGYWSIGSVVLLMKRGQKYPGIKLHQYKGHGPTYLTEAGKILNNPYVAKFSSDGA